MVFLNIYLYQKNLQIQGGEKKQITSYLFLILYVTHIYNYIIQTKASLVNLRKFLWGVYLTWSAKNYNLTKIDLLLLVPEKATSKGLDCTTPFKLGTPRLTSKSMQAT